jgi:hypothetical protein
VGTPGEDGEQGPQGPKGDTGSMGPPGGGVEDAPADGKMYFRQNGAWVALTSIDQIGA